MATTCRRAVALRVHIEKSRSRKGVGLKWCNDLIYQVVTFLYGKIGDEKVPVCFQFVALKYRVSNNQLHDMNNFRDEQICKVDGKGMSCWIRTLRFYEPGISKDTLSESLLPSITRAISTCGGFSGALFLFPHSTANKTRLNKKGSRINVWLIKHFST